MLTSPLPAPSVALTRLAQDGLWRQNPGLVQMLGLCPVLAVSTTLVNGTSLGLATALVTALSGMAVAAVRHGVSPEVRNPVFIALIAGLVTVVDVLLNAYVPTLYAVLGIFIPLITTNCIVLARAEAFASKNTVLAAGVDGLAMGLGLTLVLAVLGGLRELFGRGTLFSGIELIFGEGARGWVWHLVPAEYNYQFLLAMLPPGAFMGLAVLVAAKNGWTAHTARRAQAAAATAPLSATPQEV